MKLSCFIFYYFSRLIATPISPENLCSCSFKRSFGLIKAPIIRYYSFPSNLNPWYKPIGWVFIPSSPKTTSCLRNTFILRILNNSSLGISTPSSIPYSLKYYTKLQHKFTVSQALKMKFSQYFPSDYYFVFFTIQN